MLLTYTQAMNQIKLWRTFLNAKTYAKNYG